MPAPWLRSVRAFKRSARVIGVAVIGHYERRDLRPRSRDTILKGTPGENVDVLTRGGIAELDPDCCEIGNSYLFFLVKIRNGGFMSVNGPYGIYLLAAQ